MRNRRDMKMSAQRRNDENQRDGAMMTTIATSVIMKMSAQRRNDEDQRDGAMMKTVATTR